MRRAIVLAAMLFAACHTASYVGDESSPYYVVPAGSRLTLTQALTIPADEVGVYIQDGRVAPSVQVRRHYPFCKFSLRTLAAAPRTVAPETFTVTRALQHELDGALGANLFAGGGIRVMTIGGMDSPLRTYTTQLNLHAARQPDVFRLSCTQWGYPPDLRHVTIAEIRDTLGNLITLELATPR